MKLNEMYPSKYLKATDFDIDNDEVKLLTIRNIEMEMMGQDDEKETKPVLFFRERDVKPLVCNRTNGQIIASLYTEESDDWIGKQIYLYVTDIPSFGKMQPGIRVKAKRPPAASKPAPVTIEASDVDELFGDEPAAQVVNIGKGIPPMKSKIPA
jgi:hypothetical protein